MSSSEPDTQNYRNITLYSQDSSEESFSPPSHSLTHTPSEPIDSSSPPAYSPLDTQSQPQPPLPLPTNTPATSPPQNTMAAAQGAVPAIVTGLDALPARGSKNAPKTFRGKYNTVTRFLEHLDKLYRKYNVVTDQDRCKGITDYCSQHVCDFITASAHYPKGNPPTHGNWNGLKNELLKYYDAERLETRYRPHDVKKLINKYRTKEIRSMEAWKAYYRKYVTIAGPLHDNGIFSDREYNHFFWKGLPRTLKTRLEARITVTKPQHNIEEPYDIEDISEAAERLFSRKKFRDMFMEEDYPDSSDSDQHSESDSDSDSESNSDSEEDKPRHRKKKKTTKKVTFKKTRHTHKEDASDSDKEPVQRKEPVRRYKGSTAEIESMIQQLNTMSLQDPSYGRLYFKVMQLDASGLAAKCVYREPLKVMQPLPPPPIPARSSMNSAPPRTMTTYPNNIPINNQRQPFPRPTMDNRCFGCLDPNPSHRLADCPRIGELMNQGMIYQDPGNRKYFMRDGQPIYRNGSNESLYEAAIRLNSVIRPANMSNLVTIVSDVKSYHQHIEEESEDVTDTESEDDDGPYWKYAMHAKRELRYPVRMQDVYESESESGRYEILGAERTPKRIAENRKEVARKPITRFDGVYPPPRPRPSKPATAPPPPPPLVEPVRPPPPPPVANYPPRQVPGPFRQPPVAPEAALPSEPRPINVRKNHTVPDNDVEMRPAKPAPKSTPSMPRMKDTGHQSSKENIDKSGRAPMRQSEISAQVDTRNVVQEILDTEIALPLRKILGTSKEISQSLQDVIRLKNRAIPSANQATVYAFPVQPASNLIRLNMSYEGTPITAIIDTGSELNIIRGDVARHFQMPIDVTTSITMGDANGGKGSLTGKIENIEFTCGTLATRATLHVGDRVPFNLLLGRPWQQGNYVSIDERHTGTYLVFKDPETEEPHYEVCVTSTHNVPAKFRPKASQKVYTTTLNDESEIYSPQCFPIFRQNSTPEEQDAIEGLLTLEKEVPPAGLEPTTSKIVSEKPALNSSDLRLEIDNQTAKNMLQSRPRMKKTMRTDKYMSVQNSLEYSDAPSAQNNKADKEERLPKNGNASRITELPQNREFPNKANNAPSLKRAQPPQENTTTDKNITTRLEEPSDMDEEWKIITTQNIVQTRKQTVFKKRRIEASKIQKSPGPRVSPSTMSYKSFLPTFNSGTGVIPHPDDDRPLYPSIMSLHTPHGAVTELTRTTDNPTYPYQSHLIFPDATLTSYRHGQLLSVNGYATTTFHHTHPDANMVTIHQQMRENPTDTSTRTADAEMTDAISHVTSPDGPEPPQVAQTTSPSISTVPAPPPASPPLSSPIVLSVNILSDAPDVDNHSLPSPSDDKWPNDVTVYPHLKIYNSPFDAERPAQFNDPRIRDYPSLTNDQLASFAPLERGLLKNIVGFFQGDLDYTDGVVIPEELRHGEHRHMLDDNRVSLRFPDVERLLARAAIVSPSSIFGCFFPTRLAGQQLADVPPLSPDTCHFPLPSDNPDYIPLVIGDPNASRHPKLPLESLPPHTTVITIRNALPSHGCQFHV